MRDARQNGDRRLGFALVLLLLALGLQAQCSLITPDAQGAEAQVDVCQSGTISSRDDGDEISACIDGQWEPMLTLAESEDKAGRFAQRAGVGGLLLGLAFGHWCTRRKK